MQSGMRARQEVAGGVLSRPVGRAAPASARRMQRRTNPLEHWESMPSPLHSAISSTGMSLMTDGTSADGGFDCKGMFSTQR